MGGFFFLIFSPICSDVMGRDSQDRGVPYRAVPQRDFKESCPACVPNPEGTKTRGILLWHATRSTDNTSIMESLQHGYASDDSGLLSVHLMVHGLES